MEIITQGGKKFIDPPMPSMVEDESGKDEEVVETSGELVDKVVKEQAVPKYVIPVPRTPRPFPHGLLKMSEDGKGRRFINMLK